MPVKKRAVTGHATATESNKRAKKAPAEAWKSSLPPGTDPKVLLKNNHFDPSCNFDDHGADQLKVVLKLLGCPVSGAKSVLVARLRTAITDESLHFFGGKNDAVTDKAAILETERNVQEELQREESALAKQLIATRARLKKATDVVSIFEKELDILMDQERPLASQVDLFLLNDNTASSIRARLVLDLVLQSDDEEGRTLLEYTFSKANLVSLNAYIAWVFAGRFSGSEFDAQPSHVQHALRQLHLLLWKPVCATGENPVLSEYTTANREFSLSPNWSALFEFARCLSKQEIDTTFLEKVLEICKGPYQVATDMLPALLAKWPGNEKTSPWSGAASRLLQHAHDVLSSVLAVPVPTPNHTLDGLKLTCSCGICQSLHSFLVSPTETEWSHDAGKMGRWHVHDRCREVGQGLTHDSQGCGSDRLVVVKKAVCRRFASDDECRKKMAEQLVEVGARLAA
eukprot:TRINITY_DN5281_c0_g1_i1.p1 TRINITY_DN5281_c0_g1~~TRINITY_DN5281_c0_g1_i1.p1  ORF type:complete len:457 (+),score=89.15 TRINITY_DN5281_c0_g1_i1:1428-2798(+)